MDTQPTPGFWQKNKLVLKSFFISFLVLALLIPTFLITYLVTERKDRKQEVTKEISNKWSAAQTITGPFLSIPYSEMESNIPVRKFLYILPEQLDISAAVEPEIRYRSIYKVPVYAARPVTLQGKFSKNALSGVAVNPTSIKWAETKLCIGITDLKGVKEQQIKWNGQLLSMEAGMPDCNFSQQGISTSLPLDSSFLAGENNFSVRVSLQGSEKLYFTPMAAIPRFI